MRFVPALSESDRKQLTALFKYHDSHSVRRRSHSILLSADGFTIDEIARMLGGLEITQTTREHAREMLARQR